MDIREKRKEFRLTRRELTIELGVTEQAVYNWEVGKAKAREKNRRKLDEFFRNKAMVGEHID